MGFVHLHVHTEYSLLDGACRIDELIRVAKNLGQKAIAITDHGVMYGAVDFYDKAISAGLKPIIGCEVYVAEGSRFEKDKAHAKYNHLVLLCKNDVGYKNLIHLVSKGFTEGFYSKPRIDKELLRNHSEGLIALSACIAGEIPMNILNGNYNAAQKAALEYSKIFGKDSFYLELQNHGYEQEQTVNPQLIQISQETDIPLVATNDVHYVNKADSEMQNILICIGTNHTLDEDNPLSFSTEEFYLKSEEEMTLLFPELPSAISNTQKIADMCSFNFEFGKIKLPFFDLGQQNHKAVFEKMCFEGLCDKVGATPPQEYIDRLQYELDTIDKMGYTDYYLIVADFVRFARSQDIPVGPGRGSGAASLAAYCVGITGIDPIKYNLLFERFLNPERISMPDFDIDFCYVRRSEVINYVIDKYGEEYVSQIVTFGTLKAKAAVRDVGRVMNLPYTLCDSVAKLIPSRLGSTIDSALEEIPELKEKCDSNYEVKKLLDMAKRIEGMPRHASTHAAGVVITDQPVSQYVPLATSDNVIVSQYTMTNLDKLGLLKMDFLGLRNLTVIDDTLKTLNSQGIAIKEADIPLNDRDTLQMMSKGRTIGVFQYESAGMRAVLRSMRPENMEDLIAIISLHRPGPKQYIPKYIHSRHNSNTITYDTPLLKPILEVTYGCIVYQEQVMQIFTEIAGYSLGRADIVRRAMSKKKHDVLQKERKAFVYGENDADGKTIIPGAISRGVSEAIANKLFDEITAFSSYAFNKAHAAAYAHVAYQTAYLKRHYPQQYMAALLTSVLDMPTKLNEYLSECSNMGFPILSPDINESKAGFTCTEMGIRFGLMAVKNLGRNLINGIVSERERDGDFKSIFDFCSRPIGPLINKKAIENLIKSGAFDCFGTTRKALLNSIDMFMMKIESERRNFSGGQISLFGINTRPDIELDIQNTEEFSMNTLLMYEKQSTDFYISGHPMESFLEQSALLNVDLISEIISKSLNGEIKEGDHVNSLCIVEKVKLKNTKSGKRIANLVLEDLTGSISAIAFDSVLALYGKPPEPGDIISIVGKLNFDEDSKPEIVLTGMKRFLSNDVNFTNDASDTNDLILTSRAVVNCDENALVMLKQKLSVLCRLFPGETDLYICCNNMKRSVGLIELSNSVITFIKGLMPGIDVIY